MKKSLDDQIKEAELAKVKAETAEIERRSRQVRVFGVPIVQIIFGGIVVGFILLNYIRPLVDLNTDITTKEKDYNKIKDDLERIKLTARSEELEKLSDSLKIKQAELEDKTIIMGIFGSLDSVEYASALKHFQMIKANNFYDYNINPKGKGVDNQYQPQQENSLIYDVTTGLTWEQSGSKMYFVWEQAQDYIRKLNSAGYGGYSDWRLPTLKEAMSIVEPATNGRKWGGGLSNLINTKRRYGPPINIVFQGPGRAI